MANLTHDKPIRIPDDGSKSAGFVRGFATRCSELETTIETQRGEVWAALQLLEHPVFSNDTERALEILRAITNES